MSPDKLKQKKVDAIIHQLKLIDGANEEIEISKRMNSDLMVRQATKLKKEFTVELLRLLKEFGISFQMSEAA